MRGKAGEGRVKWGQVGRSTAAFVAVVYLIVLAGCTGLWSMRDGDPVPEVVSGPSWDLAALVSTADLVVKGEVASVRATRVAVGDGWRIVTDVEIIVLECLKGDAPSHLVVRTRGGMVGDTISLVSGEPCFRPGEKVWVFLTTHSPEEDGLAGHLGVVGARFGKLTLSGQTVREVSLSEAEFVSRIRSALAGGELDPTLLFTPQSGSPVVVTGVGDLVPLAYSYTGWRWRPGTTTVTYRVHTAVSTAALSSIQAGAQAWTNVGSRLRFIYGGRTSNPRALGDGVNGVYFRNLGATATVAICESQGRAYTDGPRTLYVDLQEFDLVFNTAHRWGIGSSTAFYDVQNIATHEFGHAAGLQDLYAPEAAEMTMYGLTSMGETKKRTLEGPDRQGVLDIYGRRR